MSFGSGLPTLQKVAQILRNENLGAEADTDEIISVLGEKRTITDAKLTSTKHVEVMRDQISSLNKIMQIDRRSELELRLRKQDVRDAMVDRLLGLLRDGTRLRQANQRLRQRRGLGPPEAQGAGVGLGGGRPAPHFPSLLPPTPDPSLPKP